MKRTALQERIVLNLFQAAGSTQAFFIARGDVAGRRLSFGFGLGAFEDDDVSWHDENVLRGRIYTLFFIIVKRNR